MVLKGQSMLHAIAYWIMYGLYLILMCVKSCNIITKQQILLFRGSLPVLSVHSCTWFVFSNIMYLSNQLVYSGCLKCGSDAVVKRVLHLPYRHNINTQILESTPWLTEVVDSSLTKSVVFLDTEQVSLYAMCHEKPAFCIQLNLF